MRREKGFTLIELLVVIAIIGLLSTLAVVSLNNARAKSRDAKRISDVKQIQTALELYFNDAGSYPDAVASAGAIANGGTTYMGTVPGNPTPVDCASGVGNYPYATQSSGGSYTIQFCLSGTTGGLGSGLHTATPAGIQ